MIEGTMSLPKSCAALGDRRVAAELVEQEIRVENVNAHRGQAARRIVGHRLGVGRLFQKLADAVRLVDLHHAELRTLLQLDRNAADRAVGLVVDVVLHHIGVIHFVDVVARQNQHQVGPGLLDGIDILINRVGRPLVPVLVNSLLRRQNVDEFVQLAAEEPPTQVQMPIQAGRLVLR